MKPVIPTSEAIEQAAAAWVLRRDRGFTASEQDDFLQWLAADPRHSSAYARHQRNFSRLDRLALWLPEHAPRPNPDLLAPPAASWFRRYFQPVALAAAAAVALGALLIFNRAPAPALASSPMLLAAIEQRTLEDGSVIELNRGARLSVLYTPTERRVHLEHGEAHFSVAKNPGRPFIVTVSGISVRAVGTAFNVKLGASAVEVLVTEGQVGVADVAQGRPLLPATAPGENRVLTAGQLATLPFAPSVAPQVVTLTRDELETELVWQPKLLDFTEAPLSRIVAEFNRRNPVHLVIADPEVGETSITASFRSDNVEGFVRLVEAGFSVKAERSGNTVILRRQP